ncbi:uncharacterized protein [Antedon mediterranea]|uniref:uncharacterized protein n=1 Tax=Antedon mediterranea TaxID=105859 RepID=UPI003AF98EE7
MTETTMSDSFVEREKKEKAKLILSNSKKLQEDLHSIFEREENFDLTLIYKDSKWNLHTAILEQRAPDFFKHLKDYGEEVRLKFLQEEDYGNFGNWLRALYTEDNLDIYEASVKLWISKLEKSRENRINNSDQDMTNVQENESIPTQPSTFEDGVEDVTSIINDKLSIDKQSDVPIQGSCTGDVMEVDASKRVETKFPSVPECSSRLGNDLISLLLSGKGADLELRVVDGAVMVHKFIVSGRTHYFAAMLSGAWSESSKPYIYLQNFSLSALLSILYYIYGGVLDIPETASICEVLVLADIYNLQAFKDVLMLRLKRENCHFFHKPCAECLAAVPEALALSVRFRDTNFTKACLRWMTKHFVKVWRSKSFAAMGKQLMEICYESALEELKPDTVVSLVTQSDKLLETLPRVKWNEPLVELVERLRDAALDYIAENFTVVSRHKNFQPLIQGMGWSCTLLELMFNKVVAVLNAKTANSVFMSANQLKRMAEMEEFSKGVCSVLVEFYYKCYTYMVSNANHQILRDDWNNLPEELKSKIKQDAVYVDERKKTVVPKPKLTSSSRPKTKPPQIEKADATKSKGAKPKIRGVHTKPPEVTKKTSVKPKTVNNPPSTISASAPSKSTSLQPRGLKSESTKSKDSSAKSSKIQIQSRVLSSTSTKSTGSPAKPKESSKKPSGSTSLTAAKSKEVSVKVKKPAKAKEPLKDAKLPHRPPTAPGSLNLPVQPRKTNKEVKSRAATSVQLKKSNSLQKFSDESRPASSKTNTSLNSSKASLVSNGNVSSKTQKVTKTSHDKLLDTKIKTRSRDVTATKDKTATKKKEDSLKNSGSSKPATEIVKKIDPIPSTSSDVNTTNKEPSVAVNEANNMTQDAFGEQEDRGDKAEQVDNTNSETEGKVDMVEDFDKLSGITENNVTVRLPENSEEIDKIEFLKNEPSFCTDGFKTQCPLEKEDDLSFSTTSLSNSEVLTGNVDNSLASLQSTEEKSRSSSQIPSETAIKCDDVFDEKSNNTEASDIAMDDCDPIITSDNEVEQVYEEEEGMVSEDTNRVSDDNKAMEIKINEIELDFEVPMDMTPDESEEVVNELSENKHECDYEASEKRIEDGVKEKELEYVEENDIHFAKAESSECAIITDDVLEHKDDSFTEHVFCEIKDNEHAGRIPEEDNSADLSCFLERSNDCIEVEMDKDGQIYTSDHGDEDNTGIGSVSNKEISNENIDKEQFNATNDSIPFEDDNDLEREADNIQYEHLSEDRKDEPLPLVCEVHSLEADKKMLDNFSNDTTEGESEESQYKEESCVETGGIDCVHVEATENKMAEHVVYSNDDKEATKDILYSQEENGIYTAEPDDSMMSNGASNGVQNGVDITGTYSELDTDEGERSNGRLILSKALQFGSSNGASLEPES